jgi:subtilase family serine protease
MSDLIVQDINFTISNSTENVSVYVVVKNIGNASAGASKTQLAHSGTVLQLFDIHLLNPGQVVVHGPAYVMVARGTTYQLQAKADVLNSVVESNETNNDLSVSIVMPP